MKREKANAELNAFNHGRSNNSLNASGISLDDIRQIGCGSATLPAVLIRALGRRLNIEIEAMFGVNCIYENIRTKSI